MMLVDVAPEMAELWLCQSPGNNPTDFSRVELYANAMRSGLWISHSPIVFDHYGRLLDGHHRLNAVIQAGVVVPLHTQGYPYRATISA